MDVQQLASEIYADLGNLCLVMGKPQQAVQPFERSVALNPGNLRVRLNLAYCLYRARNYVSAWTGYEEIARQARVQMTPEQLAAFVRLARRNGAEDAYPFYLGQYFLYKRRYRKARVAFERDIAHNPTAPESYASLGDLLIQGGHFEEARSILGSVLEGGGLNLCHLKPAYAYTCGRLGLHSEAVTAYVEALDSGVRLDEERLQQFRALVEDDQENARAHFHLSLWYKSRGDLGEAIAESRRALSIEPTLWEAHLAMGDAFLDAQNYENAIGAYLNAISYSPDDPEVRVGIRSKMAQCLSSQGRYDKALGHWAFILDQMLRRSFHAFRVALESIREQMAAALREHEDPEGHLYLALYHCAGWHELRQQGMAPMADEHLSEARVHARIVERDAPALFVRLSDELEILGIAPEALDPSGADVTHRSPTPLGNKQALQQEAAAKPEDARLWLRLAEVCEAEGSDGDAILAYEEAKKRAPEDASLYLKQGRCHMKQGEFALAKQQFEYVRDLHGADVMAELLRAVCLAAQGSWAEAQSVYGSASKNIRSISPSPSAQL